MVRYRSLAFVLVFLVIGLFSFNIVFADGVCYRISGSCEPARDENTCFGLDSPVEVNGVLYKNKFNESIDNIPECTQSCCCEHIGGRIISHNNIIRGLCMIGGYEVVGRAFESDDACSNACVNHIPQCNYTCGFNQDNCLISNGTRINSGLYYCNGTKRVYNDQLQCKIDCNLLAECEKTEPNNISEITMPCICGGEVHSSGYCCYGGPNGIWSNSSDDCISNACVEEGYFCAVGCDISSDELEIRGDYNYDPNNPVSCPEETPYCCSKPAPEPHYCCTAEEFCSSSNLLDHIEFELENRVYLYSDCSEDQGEIKVCSVNCTHPPCLDINAPINESNEYQPDPTKEDEDEIEFCWCEGIARNTNTDAGYCCGDKYYPPELGGCIELSTGTISIEVRDMVNNIALSGVVVSFDGKVCNTDSRGICSFSNVVDGSYDISFFKEGFATKSITVVTSFETNPTMRLVVGIEPTDVSSCYLDNPPVPVINLEHVRGVKAVDIKWSIQQCDNILGFIINRTDPKGHYNITYVDAVLRSYRDDTVSWNTLYNYSIRAIYSTNILSDWGSQTILTGMSLCEGVFDDNEFCVDGNMKKEGRLRFGVTCNNENRVTANTIKLFCSDGEVCVGPDENGKTTCKKITDNCMEEGDVTPNDFMDDYYNPFGLYYTKERCQSEDKYCFYDFSLTSVDMCYSCEEKTCYDYKSKEACEEDNCGVGGEYAGKNGTNQGCKWMATYEELGRGICYDPDFDGDMCYLCNKYSDVFFNLCNSSICSALGSCYFNVSGGSCERCEKQGASITTCEKYKTKEDCIGAGGVYQNFVIEDVPNVCNTNVRLSNDACGVGLCRWDDNIGCYKDGDGNGIMDCITDSCRVDISPPNTRIIGDIPLMGKDGADIIFEVEDNAGLGKFYYCVSQNPECCPDKELDLSGTSTIRTTIRVNPIDEGISFSPGIYYIRYFSEDENKNFERIKETSFYVDNEPPDFSLYHYSQLRDDGRANLTIVLQSDEYVRCSYSFNEQIPVPIRDDFSSGNKSKVFYLALSGLEKSFYYFTVSCVDDLGNEKTNTTIIRTPLTNIIRNARPNYVRFNRSSVEIRVDTTLDTDCLAKGISGTNQTIQLTNKEEFPTGNFTHWRVLQFKNGSYAFRVECTSTEVPDLSDSVNIFFTVDNQPPVTSIRLGGSDEEINEIDFVSFPLVLELSCDDSYLGSPPGEYECDSKEDIFWCATKSICVPQYHPLSPSTIYIEDSETANAIFFYSVDKGGNREKTRGFVLRGDNKAPIITLNALPSVTVSAVVVVSGNAYDPIGGSGIVRNENNQSYVIVRVVSDDGGVREYQPNLNAQNNFVVSVVLFPGYNNIYVLARDKAGNSAYSEEKRVYYDLVGPLVIPGIYDYTGLRIDFNQSLLINPFAERSHLINFSAIITDPSGLENMSVLINCNTPDLCGTLNIRLNMVPAGENVFYAVLPSGISTIGNYTARFLARDGNGYSTESELQFSVKDSIGVILRVNNPPPDIVYSRHYVFKGTTHSDDGEGTLEPNLLVIANINERKEFSTYSMPFSEPRLGFYLNVSEPLRIPKEGDLELILIGNWSNLRSGDYLEFSNHERYPRYLITSVETTRKLGGLVSSTVRFTPPLARGLDANTKASIYSEAYKTGYFNLEVNLTPGSNYILLSAVDSVTGDRDIMAYYVNYTLRDFYITGYNPHRYTKEISPKLRVVTNILSNCQYRNIPSEQNWYDFPQYSSMLHEVNLGELKDDTQYNYIVRCFTGFDWDSTDENERLEFNISFIIKLGINKPEITSIMSTGVNVINERTPIRDITVNGLVEPYSEISIYVGDVLAGETNLTSEGTFSVNISLPGQEKRYNIQVRAIDLVGNINYSDVVYVIYNTSSPLAPLTIVRPRYNLTSSPIVNIVARTKEPSDCFFSWGSDFDSRHLKNFSSDDTRRTHYITIDLRNKEGERWAKFNYTYNVRCVNFLGESSTLFDIPLNVDVVPLNITKLISLGGTVIPWQENTILVETSKEAICRYSDGEIKSFADMEYNITTKFTTRHSLMDTFDDRKYALWVDCMDRAGQTAINPGWLNFTVRLRNLTILGFGPNTTIANKTPMLWVKLNKAPSECFFNDNSAEIVYPKFEIDRVVYFAEYRIKDELEDGRHNYDVYCRHEYNPSVSAVISFVVNTTPPGKPVLTSLTNNSHIKNELVLEGSIESIYENVLLYVMVNNSEVGLFNVENNEFYEVIDMTNYSDGTYLLSLQSQLPGADESSRSDAFVIFVIKDTISEPPILSDLPASVGSDSILVRGRAEPYSTVTLFKSRSNLNGSRLGTTLCDQEGNFSFMVNLDEGWNYFYSYANDSLNNPQSERSNVIFTYYDNKGPGINIIRPRYQENEEMFIIKANITDDSVIKNITLYINGSLEDVWAGGIGNQIIYNYGFIFEKNGTYLINITAYDEFGNFNYTTRQFVLDTAMPDPPRFNLDNAILNYSNPTLEFVFDTGVTIDGLEGISAIPGGNIDNMTFSFYPHPDGFPDKVYNINLYAHSSVGLRTVGNYSFTFTIDTTPPEVEISDTVIDKTTVLGPININGSCSDNTASDHSILIKISEGGTTWETHCTNGRYSKEITLSGSDGEKYVHVEAIDLANNTNRAYKVIQLDTGIPDINITNIVNSDIIFGNPPYRTNDDQAVIIGTFYDSNFDRIDVYINGVKEQNPSIQVYTDNNTFIYVANLIRADNRELALTYTFVARDNFSLANNKSITIISDSRGPIIEEIIPKTNTTSEKQPTIKIRTNEKAISCFVDYTKVDGYRQRDFFSTNDGINHTVILSSFIFYEENNTKTQEINITCSDMLGNQLTTSIGFTVDLRRPTITDFYLDYSLGAILATEDDSIRYYVVRVIPPNAQGSLIVTTDEDTRCNITGSFEGKFYDNYDYYSKEHSIIINIGDNTIYEYSFVCEDKAGLKTNIKKIKIEANSTFRPGKPFINPIHPPIDKQVSLNSLVVEFSGSIVPFRGYPITIAELIIGDRTYILDLDADGFYAENVTIQSDGIYDYTILAIPQEGPEARLSGRIEIDTKPPEAPDIIIG